MNEEEFWKLIQRSKRGTEDCDDQSEKLTELLTKLDLKEITDFDRNLLKQRIKSYRYDIWAVAYIINGGCSDDGFEYFRGWLIAQGKEFFNAVLENPEYTAKKVKDGDGIECEEILYVAYEAYKKRTGDEMPPAKLKYPSKPKGKRWEEDDLEKMYPKLYKRFFS